MSIEPTELRFMTLVEAAAVLQVSKRTIFRMIQKGQLPALKVGGQWRIRECQLKSWAERKEYSLPGSTRVFLEDQLAKGRSS